MGDIFISFEPLTRQVLIPVHSLLISIELSFAPTSRNPNDH